MAKVLLLNGSPRANGCTAAALAEMIRVFEAEGVETELIQVGNKDRGKWRRAGWRLNRSVPSGWFQQSCLPFRGLFPER